MEQTSFLPHREHVCVCVHIPALPGVFRKIYTECQIVTDHSGIRKKNKLSLFRKKKQLYEKFQFLWHV